MKNRFASVIFPVLALFLVSFAIYAPAARAQSWGAAVLHSFEGADGFQPQAGVIQGSDGNFYGTTLWGGTNGRFYGTVFRIASSGTLTTVYSFCNRAGCQDGVRPYPGLIQGNDGSFYGTTLAGGGEGYGTVFKLTPSGTLTTLYSFCSVVDHSTGYCVDGQAANGVIQWGPRYTTVMLTASADIAVNRTPKRRPDHRMNIRSIDGLEKRP